MSRSRLWKSYGVTVAVALIAVWAVGRSSAGQTEQRVRAEMRDSVAWEVSRRIEPLRKQATVDSVRWAKAERALARARASGTVAIAHAETVTIASGAVLADTAATVLQLRGALYVQTATTERVVAEFHAYVRASDSLHAASRVLVASQVSVIAQTDAALIAMTQARDAWRQAASCRVLWLPCPTRTQAFVAGAVLTLGAVVAVTR